MGEAWGRGNRDGAERTPLQGPGGAAADPAERRDRHVLLGVSHPSGDPARHRVFELRAAFDAAAGGWVARVAEQDRNEQPARWDGGTGEAGAAAFPSPAECLGDAARRVVAAVDREAAGGG